MPTTLLFWNVNRNRAAVEDRIARLVRAHAVDVLILAEYPDEPAELIGRLTAAGTTGYRRVSGALDPLCVLTRKRPADWHRLYTATRFQILEAHIGSGDPLLLVAAHLRSKANASGRTQRALVSDLTRTLAGFERRPNAGTILVGDLNMNPFEEGVASADALNAVSTRATAAAGTRSLHGTDFPFFYNPMWGLFGDRTPGPPGTYYRSAGEQVNYYWNMYDQVLVRPSLMDRLGTVAVLADDGSDSLLTRNGLPDVRMASDHLPLLFTLDFGTRSL